MHPVSSSTLPPPGEDVAPVRRFKPASDGPAKVETIIRFEGKAKTAAVVAAVGPSVETPVKIQESAPGMVREIGGRKDGLEPTRYGDWEKNGRCIDF